MNYKELKDKINEVKWGVHISRLKNLPTSNVYLLPNNDWETNKLGNKVVIHRSSVYLSTISQDDFNRQFKLGQQLAEDGSIAIDSSLVSTFDFNQIKSAKDKITSYLSSFFSPEFIIKNDVLSRVNTFKNTKKITGKDRYQSIRFEEKFDTYKVVLGYSPINSEVTLSLHNYDSYNSEYRDYLRNPVSDFFNYEYEYDGYFRALKKHQLDFFEKQGAPMYPEATYNFQSFKIMFNVSNVEGMVWDVLKKSANSQKRMVFKLGKYLYLLFGNDLNGLGVKNLKVENTDFSKIFIGYDLKEKINVYKGYRIYSLPLFDIEFTYMDYEAFDDDGNEFLVAGMHVNIIPFKANKDESSAWYLHPFVYEWTK